MINIGKKLMIGVLYFIGSWLLYAYAIPFLWNHQSSAAFEFVAFLFLAHIFFTLHLLHLILSD